LSRSWAVSRPVVPSAASIEALQRPKVEVAAHYAAEPVEAPPQVNLCAPTIMPAHWPQSYIQFFISQRMLKVIWASELL